MSELENLLGDEISENQLRGNQDAKEIVSEEQISEKKTTQKNENKEIQSVQDVKGEIDKTQINFEEKYQEEKGYRTRLLSENKQFKKELNDLRALKQKFENLSKDKEFEKIEANVPDPKVDPIGYLQHTLSLLRSDIDSLKNKNIQVDQTSKQAQDAQVILKVLQNSAVAYREQNVDFDDAVKYLSDSRTKELKIYGHDDAQIDNIINYDILVLTQKAIEQEINPAELLFDLAKVKGFVSKKEVKEGFDKNEKGSKRSKSLSSVGDMSQVEENLSLTDLLNLSDNEFDKNWDKVMKKKL